MERNVYRIIDANFNRAREASRLIEEFCRFALNSSDLTSRTKQLRHDLSTAINKLDTNQLIASRDTIGDIGIGKKAEGNLLKRTDIKGCFIASCKRLVEALRVLSELIETIDPKIAGTIESLRYTAYTLEKDITLFSNTTEKFKKVKLYVIITSELPAEIISLTQNCIAGGADCIQLRAKTIADDKFFAVATEFVKICKTANVLSIINDRVDIAIAANADGAHFGQNDLSVSQAQKLQLTPLVIGKSTHSIDQLKIACNQRPAYVALGPVYITETKPTAKAVGLNYIKRATEILSKTGICNVAIGGITLNNLEEVLKAGAGAIAVCSAITHADDPLKACQKFKDKIAKFFRL